MDIVVTVPKGEIEHFEKDKVSIVRQGGEAWWFVRNFPLKSNDEDQIYFVLNGAIRWVAHIHTLDRRRDGYQWRDAIVFTAINKVDPPIPMKGFQGFGYYDS